VIVVVKEPADLTNVLAASQSLGFSLVTEPIPLAAGPEYMFKGTIAGDKVRALAGIVGILSVEPERQNRAL
jgi:hypothetical protein